MRKPVLFCLLLLGCLAPKAHATITSLYLTVDLNARQAQIDISWKGAWNTPGKAPNNRDGVWLFIKYKRASETEYRTLLLSDISSDHSSGSTVKVTACPEKTGVMGETLTPYNNTISEHFYLKIADTLSTSGNYDFKAYAIEMVYVPAGPFYAGDGASNYSLAGGAVGTEPLYVDGNPPYAVHEINKNGAGNLNQYAIPGSFPAGFSPFWCMKYEITQKQFVDYLNTLTASQQKQQIHCGFDSLLVRKRVLKPNRSGGFRNGVVLATNSATFADTGVTANFVFACDANADSNLSDSALVFNYMNDNHDGLGRACNFLSWKNLSGYLAWSGLRPLSELEFEKLCRGPQVPLAKEYAWGTQNAHLGQHLVNNGTPDEAFADTIPSGYGPAVFARPVTDSIPYTMGPVRTGAFAGNKTGRVNSGAGYYGAMELSGNVWEPVVSLQSSGFNGSQDGTRKTWPDSTGSGVILRGGAWFSTISNNLSYAFRDLAVSDRFYRDTQFPDFRNTTGGRGGRTATGTVLSGPDSGAAYLGFGGSGYALSTLLPDANYNYNHPRVIGVKLYPNPIERSNTVTFSLEAIIEPLPINGLDLTVEFTDGKGTRFHIDDYLNFGGKVYFSAPWCSGYYTVTITSRDGFYRWRVPLLVLP